jgi:hypothetical protein
LIERHFRTCLHIIFQQNTPIEYPVSHCADQEQDGLVFRGVICGVLLLYNQLHQGKKDENHSRSFPNEDV